MLCCAYTAVCPNDSIQCKENPRNSVELHGFPILCIVYQIYFTSSKISVTVLYHLSLLSTEKKYPFGFLCLLATLAKGILSVLSCNLQLSGFGGCSFHFSTNRLQPFSMCFATLRYTVAV